VSIKLLFTLGGMTGALLEYCLNYLYTKHHKVPFAKKTRIAYLLHKQQAGLEHLIVADGPEISKHALDQA
jgi:fructose-1-phosphate kinase PfkB-like protein